MKKVGSDPTLPSSMRKNIQGFGLIEIVIVTAVMVTALFAFSQAGTLAIRLLRAEKENLEATLLTQEALEATRSFRDESWSANIAPLANGARYYPIVANNKWSLTTAPPPLINGKYLRYIIFDQVLRDSQDRIASSGTPDDETRKVTARTEWTKNEGTAAAAASAVELITYLTNFQEYLSQ